MKWSYFKNARGLNEKKYFEKRKLLSKNEIKGFLDKNNFTYSENELQIIYDTVLPKEKPEVKKQETKKLEGKKSVLPQKKKEYGTVLKEKDMFLEVWTNKGEIEDWFKSYIEIIK